MYRLSTNNIFRYMIDDLELSGEFVLDLRIKLCYTKGQNCEQDIAAVTGLRLPKPLCQLQLGQLPIPGIVYLRRIYQIISGFIKQL